ncbi:glycosyltransferase family 4 protein [Luteimonas deserti]|nr:glycosyltransferase family 4 protein [Luteimonas deserti]
MSEAAPDPLDVLMVASSFPSDADDWRAVFMRELANALGRQAAIQLRIWAPPGDTGPGVEHVLQSDDANWLSRLMREGGIAHLLRTRPLYAGLVAAGLLRRLRRSYLGNADIDLRHVNWLQNALALPDDRKPLVVTALGSDLALLRYAPIRWAVRRLLKRRPAIVCPNAGWMVTPLRGALGGDIDIREVPFGIDAIWYDLTRAPLQTPHRWLAVTRLTSGKLGDLFAWAAPYFEDDRRHLDLIGPMQEAVDIPEWVHYHGPATPAQLCEHWFPSATGLITLSRHAEGRPQVMLEAMAAGLPIIASDIDAHASFLRHDETAWLCNSPGHFRDGLLRLENADSNTVIGEAARNWARSTIGTWNDCAARYLALYRELLELPPRD